MHTLVCMFVLFQLGNVFFGMGIGMCMCITSVHIGIVFFLVMGSRIGQESKHETKININTQDDMYQITSHSLQPVDCWSGCCYDLY